MEPAQSETPPGTREGTYVTIIKALKSNPAYLLVFAVGLLGGTFGIGTTVVGFISGNNTMKIVGLSLGFGAWTLLLVAALLVIRFVERRRHEEPTFLPWLSDTARKAFLAGPAAEHLSGSWKVRWFEGEGEQKKPYSHDPEEVIQLETEGCRILGSAYDPSTKKNYFLQGRLSDHGIVTLTYWSAPEMGIKALVGVMMLTLGQRWNPKSKMFIPTLLGWWRSFDRDGRIVTGEVEWIHLG